MKRYFLLAFYLFFCECLLPFGRLNKEDQENYLKGKSFFYQKRYLHSIDLFQVLSRKAPGEKRFQYYYSLSLVNYLQYKTWLDRAKTLHGFKRFNHALLSLAKAETIYPFGKEIQDLKDQIKKDRDSHLPLSHLSKNELRIFKNTTKLARNELKKGNNEKALKFFAQSLSLAPESTTALEGYNDAQKRFLAGQNEAKINVLLKQARALYRSNKLVQALAKYNAVLRFDPANGESIGRISRLKGKISTAKVLTQRKALANQYRKTGQNFVKNRAFQKAIEQYELGKVLLPDFARWDALIKQANVLQGISDKKEKQKLNERVERNYNRGLAFVASERYRDAVTAFQQVVTDAQILQRTFMVEQAQELLKRVTNALIQKEEEVVGFESPYYNLIQTLKAVGLRALEAGKLKAALKAFTQIADLFPYNRFANQYLAVCKIRINPKTKDEIMKDFMKEAKGALAAKEATKARRILDIILFIDKNYKGVKALESLIRGKENRVIGTSASPKQLEDLWNQALSARKKGLKRNAIQIARQILRLSPAHTNARSLLARLESGRIVRASRENIPSGAKKAYTQGILHYNTGALQQALVSFQTAIRIYPNYRKASIALQKCQKYLAAR